MFVGSVSYPVLLVPLIFKAFVYGLVIYAGHVNSHRQQTEKKRAEWRGGAGRHACPCGTDSEDGRETRDMDAQQGEGEKARAREGGEKTSEVEPVDSGAFRRGGTRSWHAGRWSQ